MTDEEFENVGKYNFDHPNAFDWDLIRETFAKLCRREDIVIPRYNYKTCRRDEPGISLKCCDLILFEGIFALWDPQIRDLMDLKIFVHTDDDIRLLRRLKRDVLHRGRTVEGVIKSYNRFVKSSYDEYIKPTMKYSDIIIPKGGENEIGISFVTSNLKNKLKERGVILGAYAQSSNTLNDIPNIELPIIDEVLVNYQSWNQNLRVLKFSGDNRNNTLKRSLESILLKQLYGQDQELYEMHFEFLAKHLLNLLKSSNPDEQINSASWQFLNLRKECWIYGTRHLTQEMELIQTDQCTNLCVFLPETCSKNLNSQHVKDLLETIRQLSGFHNIEKIHFLSFFMGSSFSQSLQDVKSFENIYFYTIYLNNEMGKYPSFIEDHLKEKFQENGDDMTLENKLEAFKMKGSLNTDLCYQTFYGQEFFETKHVHAKID